MFSVPGVEFAYAQAPVSMKSVVMSCWLLTTTVGNLIVIIIEAATIFELAVSAGFKNQFQMVSLGVFSVVQRFSLLGNDVGGYGHFWTYGYEVQIRRNRKGSTRR